MRAAIAVVGLIGLVSPATAGAGSKDYARYVNPFIGTAAGIEGQTTVGGAAGGTQPGPMLPNGMIRMSPDTRVAALPPSGNYDYNDSQIGVSA